MLSSPRPPLTVSSPAPVSRVSPPSPPRTLSAPAPVETCTPLSVADASTVSSPEPVTKRSISENSTVSPSLDRSPCSFASKVSVMSVVTPEAVRMSPFVSSPSPPVTVSLPKLLARLSVSSPSPRLTISSPMPPKTASLPSLVLTSIPTVSPPPKIRSLPRPVLRTSISEKVAVSPPTTVYLLLRR